jgi:hypothetical protein
VKYKIGKHSLARIVHLAAPLVWARLKAEFWRGYADGE